jgi:hypothetical protein
MVIEMKNQYYVDYQTGVGYYYDTLDEAKAGAMANLAYTGENISITDTKTGSKAAVARWHHNTDPGDTDVLCLLGSYGFYTEWQDSEDDYETKKYLSENGKKGGSVKTEAKTATARVNGKSGGRPAKEGNAKYYIYGQESPSGYEWRILNIKPGEKPEKTCKQNGWTFHRSYTSKGGATKAVIKLNIREELDPANTAKIKNPSPPSWANRAGRQNRKPRTLSEKTAKRANSPKRS